MRGADTYSHDSTSARRTAGVADSEAAVVAHHSLDAGDLAVISTVRIPATRLGYALQLCCPRYPGRHLRAGELLPAIMLDHIAEQVGVETSVIADFARRTPTRYDQLAIKMRFGFRDLSRPLRGDLMAWLTGVAMPVTDGRVLLDRLLAEMRDKRIVTPGISAVKCMAAEAMHRAEMDSIATIDRSLDARTYSRLDTLVDDKVQDWQSRLSRLRELASRVAPASLSEIVEKVTLIRWTRDRTIKPWDQIPRDRICRSQPEDESGSLEWKILNGAG